MSRQIDNLYQLHMYIFWKEQPIINGELLDFL